MRRIVVLLAVAASLTIGSLSAGASSAFAAGANCFPSMGQIFYTGAWEWSNTLSSCTQVNAVQFFLNNGQDGVTWHQGSGGRFFPGLAATKTIIGAASSYTTDNVVSVFGPGCGAPPIVVSTQFTWRIRNAVGSTWGTWRLTTGGNYIIC